MSIKKQHFLLISIFALISIDSFSRTKTVVICGAGGFIGHHLVKRYKQEGYWVRGVDIKTPEFEKSSADDFLILDLRIQENAYKALDNPLKKTFDEVVQLAANMGGMGFLSFHDAEIMHDSVLINLNILEAARRLKPQKIFFSSSACVYPNQFDPLHVSCKEEFAYPAHPDNEYGWEKLFSERIYASYARDYNMDIRMARFHSIFGTHGAWRGGREKAPAALCRKVILAKNGDEIEVWGSGKQTRSFLYIDECIEGIRRIMQHPTPLPVLNLGSTKMISINELAQLIITISEKKLTIKNIPGPEGVLGRNSDNTLLKKYLDWEPKESLETELYDLYVWIKNQIKITPIT